jgi:hypothetical protein
VIAFKEGEPIGDCSYPVSAGMEMIIAPVVEPDGRLTADLVTLQADPTSDAGRRFLAEAEALFGPGVVPAATGGGGSESSAAVIPVSLVAAAVAGAVVVLFTSVLLAARRQRVQPRDSR